MNHHMTKMLAILAVFLSSPVNGQSSVEEGRAMVQEARVEIIRSELRLTEEEAAAFWPLHAAYSAETADVMDRYAAMIAEYVQRYDSGDLSDEYAIELMSRFFAIKRELLDVKTRFLPKFKEVIPPLKVARFYHLENKIDADIDAQLAIAVPLIEAE